jgi:hypothetical protein
MGWAMHRGGRAASAALLAVLVLLPAAAGAPRAARAADEAVFFPETGYWVDAEFARFWSEHGGLMTFGYPISRVFYQDGLHRQYFERAIFEHHEEHAGTPYSVLLTRIGAHNTSERRKSEMPFQPRDPDPVGDVGGVYFQETGHTLSTHFRDYWEQQGGLQAFGYPLSDEFSEPGWSDGLPQQVQYFERARFEWHPENAGTPFAVLLGHLGWQELLKRDVPALAVTRQRNTPTDRDAPPIGPTALGSHPMGCGFNYLYWSDVANDVTNQIYLDLAKQSGCTWLRLQFSWSVWQPTPDTEIGTRSWPIDRIIQLAGERGLRLLVNTTHPPEWARPSDPRVPADPEAYQAFMTQLVSRYRGQVDAWQIWNEPNLIDENNGTIDPAGFLTLLKAGSAAVRAADPSALVVFPGLAPNSLMYPDWAMDDTWYLETILGLHGGEALEYFDVLGVHAYGAGNDPDTYWPSNLSDNPGWTAAREFYFRSVEHLHQLLVAAGGADKPVWITEMGWPSGDVVHDVYGYGRWITEQMQADYLTRALEIIRTEWPWVENAFIWHLNASAFAGPTSSFGPFSVTNQDYTPRPAYLAIQELVASWDGD